MHINIPVAAQRIINILKQNGHEAYVVGGCVRDSLLGREPEDWDITTSALPMEIKKLFNRTIDTGIQHGTVTIRMGGVSYETTTFRIDGIYEDSRHPKQVEFTSLLSEDLKRRDFTINAMAYSPFTGLIDIYGGVDDLNNRIIRCVGDADERFNEDALRTLRAIRFAGQLDFEIEEKTYQAIINAAQNIKNVSIERIYTEITKLIMSPGADRMFAAYDTGLTEYFLPEWNRLVKEKMAEKAIFQINYINEHYKNLSYRNRKILCYASLMLDMDDVGSILRRLKFDNYSLGKITGIVKYHKESFNVDRYTMKKLINEAGKDTLELTFIVKEVFCDVSEAKKLFDDIIDSQEPIYIKDLKISGTEIINMGVPAGKKIGIILNILLEEVLCDPKKNTEEYLRERTKGLYKEMKK